jgi:sulfur-oxidizing protein SoxX
VTFVRATMIGLGVVVANAAQADTQSIQRGDVLIHNRQQSLCILCHKAPGAQPGNIGDLAPDLSNIGQRMSRDDIRRHIIAPEQFNPETIMPSFARTKGLRKVAPGFAGQPILTMNQIDDISDYLAAQHD